MITSKRIYLDIDTHIAFIDLDSAFDKVNWINMLKTLKNIGVNYRDRRIICNLYKNQQITIEIGTETTKAKIKQEVRQGCPLSPTIFNIFIENAIAQITESETCSKSHRQRPCI